ncbi:AAA family ATPase [Pseudorhodoferax sp.]|uniref:AAA family ATPase n=1 Tax=Pseudorhodoferax sp. TaxID=1993553 RepID=UPI0039E355A3
MSLPSPSPLQRRQISILMCDLVGFTVMSEQLDPEALAEAMHTYRQACTATIERHGGVVAQYIGDGILAYFGYPHSREDDAERAVRAALDLVPAEPEQVPALGPVRLHVGVATGLVVVGNIPDAPEIAASRLQLPHHDVAAIGLAINLASRLQALAPPGVALVADETRALTRSIFRYEDYGRHPHKGFAEPQQAWRVTGERVPRSRFAALRAAELTPLVGRNELIARLQQRMEQARGGAGRVVLLSGEPGVGKSRLAEAMAASLDPQRARSTWFACWPHLQNSPLAPLIRHLTRVIGIADGDPPETVLDRIDAFAQQQVPDGDEFAPLLADLLAVPTQDRYPPLPMSPQRQRARLFALLMQTLRAAAEPVPLLVVVEDLHWADPSTDELVATFVALLKDWPVLALLTARPDFAPRWAGEPHVETIALEPLETAAAVRMVESICGRQAMPPALVQAIARRADGMPLFIEDLTRDLLERVAGGAAHAPEAEAGTAPIPMTLTDALAARLDRLGPTRRIAQVASVIGREFSGALLASVCGLSDAALQDALQQLIAAGLVVPTPAAGYMFRHALVRDAAYASLLRKEQQALHARIAERLAQDFPDTAPRHPELLAQHLEDAGQLAGAVPHLLAAARLAARRSGFAEALALLERALRLLQTLPPTRARTEQEIAVLSRLGALNVRHRGFSAPESRAAYAAALQRCRALGDAPDTCAVLSALGSCEIMLARFDLARQFATECLALAQRQSGQAPHIMAHRLLGGALLLQGEFAQARTHLEQALQRHAHAGADDPAQGVFVQDYKSSALCYLAVLQTIMGDAAAGREAALASLAHARSIADAHTVNFALCFLACVCHIAGDADAAWLHADASLALAREQDFPTWVGVSQLVRGTAAIAAGRRGDGARDVQAGISAYEGMAAVAYQTFAVGVMAQAMLGLGRSADAAALAGRAIAAAEATGERFYLAEILRTSALAQQQAGDAAAAEATLARAIALAQRQGASLFEARARRALEGLGAGMAAVPPHA